MPTTSNNQNDNPNPYGPPNSAIQNALDGLYDGAPEQNPFDEQGAGGYPPTSSDIQGNQPIPPIPLRGDVQDSHRAEDSAVPGSADAPSNAPTPRPVSASIDDIPEDAPMGRGANNAWRALRQQLKEAKAELARRNATDITEGTSEIEKWKTKYETTDAELSKLNLERSSSFKAKFDNVMRDKVTELGELGLESSRLRDYIVNNQSDDEIAEDLSTLSPAARLKAFQLVGDYKKLLGERKQALEDWKHTRDNLDAQEKETKRKKTVESVTKNVESAVQEALEAGNAFYAPIESNEDWEKARKKRLSELQTVLEANDSKQIAKYVAAGITTLDYQNAYIAANNQLNESRKEIARLRRRLKLDEGATPYVSGGEHNEQAPRATNESYSVAEGVRRWFDDI